MDDSNEDASYQHDKLLAQNSVRHYNGFSSAINITLWIIMILKRWGRGRILAYLGQTGSKKIVLVATKQQKQKVLSSIDVLL